MRLKNRKPIKGQWKLDIILMIVFFLLAYIVVTNK